MSTPFDLFGVAATAGSKIVAALYLPAGLVTAAGTTITGGTVTGTPTVPTGAAFVYMGLSESPAQIFGGTSDIGGTALPDSTNRPYTVAARVVPAGTDMTSYTAIAAAFVASADVVYSRDVPPTLFSGALSAGAWVVGGTGLNAQQTRDAMKLAASAGAAAVGSVDDKLDNVIAGGGGGGTGDGDTPVTEDTGGVDALRVTYNGAAADNVRIVAYLKSEYDAGNFVGRGTTYTGPDGRWVAPLMLNTGQIYNLVAQIPGLTQPKVIELTV